jgi:hypothetical protein
LGAEPFAAAPRARAGAPFDFEAEPLLPVPRAPTFLELEPFEPAPLAEVRFEPVPFEPVPFEPELRADDPRAGFDRPRPLARWSLIRDSSISSRGVVRGFVVREPSVPGRESAPVAADVLRDGGG